MIRVQFWGTRGGFTSPQWATGRYGGNTPCVQVTGFEDDTPGAAMRPGNPQVILDGGTGLLTMQPTLMRGPAGQGRGELHFLLSHYHWDHIMGIPFFDPLFLPGNRAVFYGVSIEQLRTSIERLFTSVYSPIKGTQNLPADLAYRQVVLDGMEVAGFHVRAAHNVHPAGSLSFRLQYGSHAVVYTTDHSVEDPDVDSRLVELARGADLWILAAAFSEEYKRGCPGSHSTHLEVTRLAVEAEVETAVLFHHGGFDDSTLDRRELEAAELAKGTQTTVLTARDGMVMETGDTTR
jgi:phosphoribosyl 1,2-cyclic phosphodiesterase